MALPAAEIESRVVPGRLAAGAAAALLLAALSGCAAASASGGVPPRTGDTTARVAGSATPSGGGSRVAVPEALRTFRSTRRLVPVPAPSRLRIAAIHVDSPLERLTRHRDETIGVPVDWNRAGWYAEGPRPGDTGAAVLLGHVDSPSGPAVFARLKELRRGDVVEVVRRDGSAVRFTVEKLERRARNRFPVTEVYWPTLAPELRLITCGGVYDRSAGGYQSNLIVFAKQAQSRGWG